MKRKRNLSRTFIIICLSVVIGLVGCRSMSDQNTDVGLNEASDEASDETILKGGNIETDEQSSNETEEAKEVLEETNNTGDSGVQRFVPSESEREIIPMVTESKRYRSVDVKMSDGINLSCDIWLPEGEGPFPVVLVRTPYLKSHSYDIQHSIDFENYYGPNGYALVVQDVRGRGDSDGEFYPFKNEAIDGYETIEWIGDQEWCNGDVAMVGLSYTSYTAMQAAKQVPENLKAMYIAGVPGYFFDNMLYINGLPMVPWFHWLSAANNRTFQTPGSEPFPFDMASVIRHRPVIDIDEAAGMDIPIWNDTFVNFEDGDYWEDVFHMEDYYDDIQIPVFFETGWQDNTAMPTIKHYTELAKNNDDVYLMVGPWNHSSLGTYGQATNIHGVEYGMNASVDMKANVVDFFNYYLKGEGDFATSQPKTRLFSMGDNTWHENLDVMDWFDYSGETKSLYLDTEDMTLSEDRLVESSSATYTYDPLLPSYALYPIDPEKPLFSFDFLNNNDDVLIFESQPFNEEMTVMGQPKAKLFVSSDAKDTDFIVHLCKVDAQGNTVMMAGEVFNGLRARYRDSDIQTELMVPGEVYELDIELSDMFYKIEEGSILKVIIRSSAEGFFLGNHNTGNDVGTDVEFYVANNTILSGDDFPSQIILPIN